jgi:REP element-mobilizing transposase RayT
MITMARPLRIEFPGALYHVLGRGNQKQNIFLDDGDRGAYLKRVQRYKDEIGFILYAYVLMPNHVHLLIETNGEPLSKIMQLINLTYTQYFNKKYNKVGHLFQGRYKAFLCDRDEYLLSLVRYIHLNPVRAHLVELPHEYPWSSHNEYLNGRGVNADPDVIMKMLSPDPAGARRQYEKFVNEALDTGKVESFYKPLWHQVLGDEKFLSEVQRKVSTREKSLKRPSLAGILRAIEEVTGVKGEDIVARKRDGRILFARGLLVAVCREVGHRLVDLQPLLNRDLSVLSRLPRIVDSVDGRMAKARVYEKLNAHSQP